MILMLSMLFSLIPGSLFAMEESVSITIHPPAKAQTHTESSPLIPKDKQSSSDSVPQAKPLYKRCDRGVGICMAKLCPVIVGSVLFFSILKLGSDDTLSATECTVLEIANCGTCTKNQYSCAIPSQYFTQELQASLKKSLDDTCGTDARYEPFTEDCNAGDVSCTPAALSDFQDSLKKKCKIPKNPFLSVKFMDRSNRKAPKNRKTR